LVDDMIGVVESYDYKLIRCFATNTLESQTGSKVFGSYAQHLLEYFDNHHIGVELYLGNGILLLEQMSRTYDTSLLRDLPA